MNQSLLIVGFSALSAVAVAGWLRPTNQPLPFGDPNLVSMESQYPYQPVQYAGDPRSNYPMRRAYVTPRPAYRDIDNRYTAQRAAPAYRQPRSKTKSALIIGGSAATGAAIGALAGGGKGAGIGALAGGAGGFIYDHLTRNK